MQDMIYMKKSESEILFCQKKKGFLGGPAGKEGACNLGDLGSIHALRPGFNPCIGKIPQRREWLPTPVFWLGEFRGLYSPWGHKGLDMTE